MTKHFSCIGVLAQVNKSSVKQTVNELLTLLHVNGYCVLIGDAAGAMLTARIKQAAKQVPNEQLAAECDVLIVVGGDGSMLQASSLLAGKKIPMLGVNRGRLGFLADIYPDLLHKVLAVLAGDYECDERFLLSMAVLQDGHVLHETTALNDVVLHAGKSVHTIDFELSIDGQRVYRQHADGLIVATPTGSTAYNLSAGGSIVHPSLSAICLTPMYPHTLSSRPLLVSDSSCIEIRVHEDNRTQPMVSPDGKSSYPLTAKQVLRITKYPHALTLLHPKGFDFYEACRTKLHWSLYGDEFYLKNKY